MLHARTAAWTGLLALNQYSAEASGCQASGVAVHLRRLPVPRPGQVLGLVGTNGIGKSTALKILAGKLKPNLGRLDVSNAPVALHLYCLQLYIHFARTAHACTS